MWHWKTQSLQDKSTICATIESETRSIEVRSVIEGWRESEKFRDFWASSLKAIPFEAYYWEMPPLSAETLSRPFECVFVDSRALSALTPNPAPFREHFAASSSGKGYATFPTIGRDSILVAPHPLDSHDAYTHLAVFTQKAPATQVHQVWSAVGDAITSSIGANPVWVNTAGMGVSWLHIRIDSRPKYYVYEPYRSVVR